MLTILLMLMKHVDYIYNVNESFLSYVNVDEGFVID